MNRIMDIQLPEDQLQLELLKSRFLSHVKKTNTCWEWIGYKLKTGYGRFRIKEITYYSHRVSYSLFNNIIPKGQVIDHICKNTWCVNPQHIEPVTQKENIMRGDAIQVEYSKRTHCLKGHEYNQNNTRFSKKNQRICRKCDNERSAIYLMKNRTVRNQKSLLYYHLHKEEINRKRRENHKLTNE